MANMQSQEYRVIGLMSGTSMDGLDIAFCVFQTDVEGWTFRIEQAETIPYADEWRMRLETAADLNARDFQLLHSEYGAYLGHRVSDFISTYGLEAGFVASHGHTVFHQPARKLTVQVGSGAAISARCRLPVICDFRSLDVALGGQGAPLVPIGDKLLFPGYEMCLNLGGFANISYDHKGQRIAYDICPVNIVMNALARKTGKNYDNEGAMAREGIVSNYLLNELAQPGFFKQAPHVPKSLGKEWVLEHVEPVLEQYELEPGDVLRTYAEHIAEQVTRAVKDLKKGRMLVTGGGAYNTFLLERIRAMCPHEIVVPDGKIVEFKEAMVFAFLGVLRLRSEVNCLRSVTGAFRDSCGGSIYGT